MIRTFLAIFILAVSALAQTGGVPGQPKPVKADQVAGNDGTTLRALKTDTNGQLIVTAPTGASSNQVQGTAAAAAAAAGNPVQVGGVDSTGNARPLAVNSTGNIAIVNSFTTGDGMGNTSGRPAYDTAGVGQNAPLLEYGAFFNGASWDRERSDSSANEPVATTLTARNSIGAQLTEKGSRWTVTSNPAAGSVASASIALEAGVKHVVDSVCFSAGSTAAPAATSLQINIRDGATGAGTIIGVFEIDITATTGQNVAPQCITNLNLPGTAGTAMTAEFSSLLANLKEAIFITGHNVN